jgi:hypothetical protein
MLRGIASGMKYLSDMKYVHRVNKIIFPRKKTIVILLINRI